VSLSVLVIDDDAAFRELASRILTDLGFDEITEAGDAATALAQAELKRPRAALVDVGLPDADGIELARSLAALPWAPHVLLTSSDRDAGISITSRKGELTIPFVAKEDLANGALRSLLLG
jgi:CheY-like chemotaxis protein